MAEYINKKAVLDELERVYNLSDCPAEFYNGYRFAMQIVNSFKKADVAPVRHGRWVYSTTYRDADTCLCSECEQMMTTHHGERMPFCPGCGEMTVDELVKYWNGGQAPQREDV